MTNRGLFPPSLGYVIQLYKEAEKKFFFQTAYLLEGALQLLVEVVLAILLKVSGDDSDCPQVFNESFQLVLQLLQFVSNISVRRHVFNNRTKINERAIGGASSARARALRLAVQRMRSMQAAGIT